MIRRLVMALVLAGTLYGVAPAQGVPPPPDIVPQDGASQQWTLVQVLSSAQLEALWFTESLLRTSPLPVLQERVAALHRNLGTFISIRPVGEYYEVIFTKGKAKARIAMVGPQISSLEIFDQVNRSTEDGSFRLAQIFQAHPLPDVLFAPGFLREYPLDRVAGWIAFLKQRYGPYRSVTIAGNEAYLVGFERGATGAKLHLDENGKIDGLSFQPLATVGPSAAPH
jgi:hypothetical protein